MLRETGTVIIIVTVILAHLIPTPYTHHREIGIYVNLVNLIIILDILTRYISSLKFNNLVSLAFRLYKRNKNCAPNIYSPVFRNYI